MKMNNYPKENGSVTITNSPYQISVLISCLLYLKESTKLFLGKFAHGEFNAKQISLISYDQYDQKTTFNPEKLNSFFDNNLKISWKNNLIEEYNKKFIFLTNS